MLTLFQRPNLKNLPVYAIRGNHDSYFSWTDELRLNMEQSQWQLPTFYYEKFIPVGDNGEVMGILFVDSVIMLCSDYVAEHLKQHPLTDPELIRVKQIMCDDPQWITWGNSQYTWIQETLAVWDQNPYIVWKATIQHYPIFAFHYEQINYQQIATIFLPILQAHKFDLYLNGHEHILGYVQIPMNPALNEIEEPVVREERQLQQEVCTYDVTDWFGNP
jgi:hypothetical protein